MNTYNPQEIEEKIYNICQDRGYFEIDGNKKIQNKKHFCIMMPPPNITGVLHIGHALTFTLQDIITRYKRMDGFQTLYQPGIDHAGIATQNVVEKQLLAQGIKKEDLGREKFLEKVWEWKEKSGGSILSQMKKLGITPAWSRSRFTLDDGLKNSVKEAFKFWFDNGLIYQGDYMVNWCTHDGALSDIEVEYEENNGKLYYIKYPIKDSSDFMVVATTRPETYFGDSAVMVNPNDERYANFVGKKVILPLVGREIEIITDEVVDMEFGSGCVKVTPAHDVNDYEVGKRHNLESIVIFDKNGILNSYAGEFEGLERLEAREVIVKKLQESGFIESIQDYTNKVGKCYRCGNIVEPYISKQWFVDPKVANGAISKVGNFESKFYPPQWKNNYDAWNRELRPWCISRQLWWGHRIPIFYCDCSHRFVSLDDEPKQCPKCNGSNITQDPDVLDTWFSSGLWAFSTLGWGNGGFGKGELYNEGDLEKFYPNSLLITGFDILFFWVARMLLSGESILGKLPFKDIYLHALVRDENGQKMSKSKGNVIDPLDIISSHGSDALRFSLAILCAQGRDIRLSHNQLEISKNFANKLFNASNFLLMYLDQVYSQTSFTPIEEFTTPLGRYINSRASRATTLIREALEDYRFNDGASVIYRFLWGEFCDWGIELAKVDKDSIKELGFVFLQSLKLLHPYMPFITEYLYHKLSGTSLEDGAESIMVSRYPLPQKPDEEMEQCFEVIKDAIVSLRRVKASLDLANNQISNAFVKIPQGSVDRDMFTRFVSKLSKVEQIQIVDSKPSGSVGDVGEFCECYIRIDDMDLTPILKRLNSQEEKLCAEIAKLEGMLKNPKFTQNAPKDVIETNVNALEGAKEKLLKVQREIENLRS